MAPQTTTGGSGDPSQLPTRLLAVSMLQILSASQPYNAIRPIPLSVLTHVAARFLELLGESCKLTAEQAGRTTVNGWDVVGVLESLEGPGAVSGLNNWCKENAKRRHVEDGNEKPDCDAAVDTDEPERLAEVARILAVNNVSKLPSPHPLTALSFVQLSEEEATALDQAGLSSPECNEDSETLPSPRATHDASSADSDSDSDLDYLPRPRPPLRPAEPPWANFTSPMKEEETEYPLEDMSARWRSPGDIPDYIPPHFPPLPGLERSLDVQKGSLKRDATNAALDDEEGAAVVPQLGPTAANAGDPYAGPVPYIGSQLAEVHPAALLPKLPRIAEGPEEEDEPLAMLGPKADAPAAKRRRRYAKTSSLFGFSETYSHFLTHHLPSNFLPSNPKRRQLASAIATDTLSEDTLFGSVSLPPPFRAPRRSAGWLPHPAALLENPAVAEGGMRPFTTPLPASVTIPIPQLHGTGQAIVPFNAARVASTVPALLGKLKATFRASGHEGSVLGGVDPVVVGRLTRTGPPAAVGDKGEALAYVVEPKSTAAATNGGDEARYLEWGFEWRSAMPTEGLPPPVNLPGTAGGVQGGDGKARFRVREIPPIPVAYREKDEKKRSKDRDRRGSEAFEVQ